jgi:hypothetical protein
MKASVLTIALCGCGNVDKPATDASAPPKDAMIDAGPARTLRGHLDQTQPVTFGGGPKGFCTYTITLQDLDVTLEVQSSGAITSGTVQDLNVEALVGTCTAGTIPPKIAMYTLDTAKPGPGGTTLTFQGATANEPRVILTGTAAIAGAAATAMLGFKRTGTADPVLDWSVVATVALSEAN